MYKFDLQPLLNYRRYQEEVLQKELTQSRKCLMDEQKKLRLTKAKKREYEHTLQHRQKENGTVSELILYLRYLDRLSKELNRQQQNVILAEKQFNRKRQALIEIMKKRKMLEKLKEKGWKTHQQQMLRHERKLMDEAAAKQFSINAKCHFP